MSQILPQRKKHKIKAKLTLLNEEGDSSPPITVDEILAAAEGRTAETAGRQDPTIAMARAAAIGRWAVILMFLVCAVGELLPASDAVMTLDPMKILPYPMVLIGAIDLVLATLLGLGVVSLYPFVRFRAALGLGFIGFIFWTNGQVMPFIYLAGGSLGLYTSTIFVTYMPVFLAAGLGLAGLGAVSWFLIS